MSAHDRRIYASIDVERHRAELQQARGNTERAVADALTALFTLAFVLTAIGSVLFGGGIQ